MAIYGILGCGRCHACLSGRDNECRVVPPGGVGIGRDGGMAPYVSVPAAQLVPIGGLDVTQAAPLTDAGLTPYHAIQLSRDALLPGSTCVVIGIGGLGHMALQILAATTVTRIVAVDVEEHQLELARELGIEHTVLGDAEAAAQIRELTGPAPGGADVVLDFVSVHARARRGRTHLRPRAPIRPGRRRLRLPAARAWRALRTRRDRSLTRCSAE